jgi:hypothetical protein
VLVEPANPYSVNRLFSAAEGPFPGFATALAIGFAIGLEILAGVGLAFAITFTAFLDGFAIIPSPIDTQEPQAAASKGSGTHATADFCGSGRPTNGKTDAPPEKLSAHG